MPVWRIRTIILTECPKLTENRVTLPSPSLGDLIEFLHLTPRRLPSHHSESPKPVKDTGNKKPPKFLGVVLSLELAAHSSLCFFSWNKNSDIRSPIHAPLPTLSVMCYLFSSISFSASLSFYVCFFRMT